MADEQIVTSIVAKADLSSLVSEVHRASASLQQLQRELLSSNRAIASSTKLANNLFRDTLSGSGQFSSHFVNLNSDVDKFGKNLDSGRLKLKNYFQTFREHATTQKGMIRELAKEQVMLQNSVLQPLGRNAQGLMQYNVMIPRGLDAIANSGKLARMEMQIMNRALSEGATGLINWGKNTQWAGRQLTVGLTVPLTMFGTAAGKAFKEADAELVRLTKVYGGIAASSAADLKSIRDEVVETAKTLSKTMGSSFKDTIALGADIAATGKTGDDLLGSIVETTRLSILGEVDRQDAMKATLAIQTAFKQNTKELTESINFLNAVENQTSTTLADLVEAIPKAGPVIKQLGGSVKDLALYLTAMREGGINASEGANALKSGLASLINPTKQTVGMMSDFGIDVMGMVAKNTGNTTALLLDLQGALDKLDPLSKARALEQMFGKFQFARMSSLFNNLGKEGSQTLQVIDLMKASTEDLASVASRELKMVTESASGKYRRAIEGLKAELADVGEEFLGVATKFINAASKILDFFTGLPAPIKKALTFMAGFTALVGPLIMLTGVLANFFGYITKGVVQLRAFFMKAAGWKMLTPEIIAAEKAALMVENAFYSDAAAAQVLHNALQKLVLDYQNLSTASAKNRVPTNPGVSTVGGSQVVAAGRRVVDPTDPYVGDPNTRAMSHINPRNPNSPATIFGGVPGAIPVNRGISRTPQMYMNDRLPNVEGLTSVKNISTGIVPGEAAKFHALMATLGMQTEQEVALLKKTIAMGGTVSAELLNTFDDILPITQRFATSAAEQSALIVQQMRNAEITVEQAKARILALNAQIEADMGSAVSMYAAGRGRTLDLTKAPMMNQPVVDANGQFTLRDLYKKKANLSVMEEFGRLRGVRTFGAPYSMQATRLPKFYEGGDVESFGANKTTVSGPSSVGYDDRLGSVPLGGYVLNQGASMDPANAPLVAAAAGTYNDGGTITAALTPKETVFGPKIQRMPELYAAVDAANNGYSFGGQIMNGVSGYGKQTDNTPGGINKSEFKKQMKEYLRFINNPRYEDDIRVRMIMLDAAELTGKAGIPVNKAIKIATSNFDLAKARSGGSLESFIDIRLKQVKGLENAKGPDGRLKYPNLKVKNSLDTRKPQSTALNLNLNAVRESMLVDKSFSGVADLIERITPTSGMNSKNVPYLDKNVRAHLLRHGLLGYATSGHMGVSAIMPHSINSVMATLQKIGISPDILSLTSGDARTNLEVALKNVGLSKFATPDDIFTALQDDGLFKSKAQIKSGNVVRSNKKQRSALSMLLEAAASRKKWVFRGRPPVPMLVGGAFNKGGMIPGGSINSNRSSYGLSPRLETFRLAQQAANAKKREADMIKYPWIKEAVAGRNRGSGGSSLLSLLAPDKQLKILTTAKELSSRSALGSFSDTPITKYGHQISPSSGMSYPIPGVSGVYKDPTGKLVFVKGVPNELTAIHEPIGTEIMRKLFGINSPVQTARTVSNPLDPSKKSKLLALESDYNPSFGKTNVQFTEDQVIRQLAGSLLMNNKDLSRSNVFGNFNPDVGNAGVFAKASGNTKLADEMNSMEKQAMINLLAVKGGARKDFARDTSSIVRKMTPRKYGRLMKGALEQARPELVKIINGLPKELKGPYVAMLKRLDDGIDVDWSKYHSVHANPRYLNTGGPVGGSIQRGRSSYGRKGGSGGQIYGQQKLTTGLGREAVRTGTTSFYNPGQVMLNNMLDPFRNSAAMKAQYLSAAFKSMGNTIKIDSIQLAKAIDINARVITLSLKNTVTSMGNAVKGFATSMGNVANAAAASTLNFAKRAQNAIIQEQNRYASTRYPATQAPPQGFFGPGLIGKYKDQGDGVQTRKVGTLGMRKTEYLVNGSSMTAKEAKAEGIRTPQRVGGMPMGAQMGIGMAGSMGGMALMQKEKVGGLTGMQAGMGLMVGSSILPLLPWHRLGGAIKSAGTALKGFSASGAGLIKFGAMIARFAKGFGLVGAAITIASAAFKIYKDFQDAKQDASMGLSLTAKAAEQAGIKYTSLNEQMKLLTENRKLDAAAAKGGAGISVGMPGLAMSVKEMKTAKEEGKKLKDFIESLNRSKGFDETLRLVSNQKAQFIAAGMSVEQANKKIYGALANSNQSGESFKILSNQTFSGIVDKATAAEFAVGNLINTLNRGSSAVNFGKEIGAGFEGLINIFDLTIASLIGTKDATGNVIDQYSAFNQVMSGFEKLYGDKLNKPIGSQAYNELSKSNFLLGEITTRADSLAGIIAKWKLYSAGFAADLQKVDSDLAIKLAGFTAAMQGSISDLTDAKGKTDTLGRVGNALEKLKKTIALTSAASQRAAAAEQRTSQQQLKDIAKKIKLIEDEKNAKLESLRATQQASNYALELQRLQIEYSDAIARGDMTGAAQSQISIDQLSQNRSADLAAKAIEDAAKKMEAPLEKAAQAIQDKSDRKAAAGAAAADSSAVAKEVATELEKLQSKYNDLQVEAINVKLLPPEEQKAAQAAVDAKIFALITQIQKAGTGNSLMAKTIRDGFFRYFDDSGKAIALIKTSNQYVGSVLAETKTQNTKIIDLFKLDTDAITKQAQLITGGMNIQKLRDELVAALLKYRPNTPEGTASGELNQPGTAKDYSKQKTLGLAGKEAAKPPTLGGSSERYTRVNNDGMSETFAVFTYNGKSYVVDRMGGVYAFDYGAQTIVNLDKKPIAKAAKGGYINKYSHGSPSGVVRGPGTPTSDSIPAMLSDGEYVIKASSVAKYGVGHLDAMNAGKYAEGGPIRQQLPNFPWRPDMPNYWSNGKPSGSPWTGRWGELRYNPSKGKDIWGGTEPGSHFTGNIKDKSDYWHQMGEQPSKYRGPGMGIDKDPMRYAGSGASMGGIGNGAYGFGPLMLAKGGFLGKLKNLFNLGSKTALKKFGLGAGVGATWQGMEEAEKFLSLKYGANKNASGLEKWGKSIARFGFSALQGGVSGASVGKGPGFVGGSIAGTVEGLVGLIRSGSQFGVKGGAAYDVNKLKKRGDLNGISDNYFNSDYSPYIDKIAKKDLSDMSLLKSAKNIAATAGISGILPGVSGLFRSAANSQAISRQGVRVFDRSKPKFINDLMELGFMNPSRPLSNVNNIISEYQSRAKNSMGDFPDILSGKGSVNVFGTRGYAAKNVNGILNKITAFMYPRDRGINYNAHVNSSDNNVTMPIYKDTPSIQEALSMPLKTLGQRIKRNRVLTQIAQSVKHSGSPDTLFHELGHRNLNLLGGPQALVARQIPFASKGWHGLHEGFADLFQDDAYKLLKGSTVSGTLTDRLGTGRTYATNPGNSILEDILHRLSGGINGGRLHQMGTEFLVPYTNMIKNRISKDTLQRLKDMAKFEGGTQNTREAFKDLYSMITQNVPKFENGINMVPREMLALLHPREAVIPERYNKFNPNAESVSSGAVYNIDVVLNGTTVTADDVANSIAAKMRIREMSAGVNRRIGVMNPE